ncbi:NAD(P)/FAD-dependent oxidoreductase [Zobellia galactanivorans]|uniref:NAD(P)/FAD-dependent oxidoreductase n=1 Tax=Zobellia galactanivorans (strain DSM 12802 / CCUG 47099 / CIP 106680 / NCIMB 13871 / Dsij) TaxID=63186 RepID=UPI001C07EDBD|nr:NAD(P)/FAD-dependent oxidoreductase [Zobellia galactanivorans]MBU3028218.1 NAD(P)/FAD-dependent oxidoreductase [Zobellia galactanivorans]
MFDVIVIGGGAAGFYTAIHIAEARPHLKIAILERGKDVLGKVKVSGGGRCNVTHAEFDPRELVKNYPRGEKELLGPFHTYCSGDTVAFFEERGINLKIEPDGRMFPTSDSSQTIIDCFLGEAARLGIKVLKHSAVSAIESLPMENHETAWQITTIKNQYQCKKVVVATGSNPKIWKLLKDLGHSLVPAVPSLFTFNCKDKRISGIPGVSTMAEVEVFENRVYQSKVTTKLKSNNGKSAILTSDGPLLITHWGLSGPAILKLSAWGARVLNEMEYRFKIRVNWLPEYNFEGLMGLFSEIKEIEAKKTVLRTKAVEVPRRLWTNLVRASDISETDKWADITKNQLEKLARQLTECELKIDGKSTFKEEFVTAGGIDLKEINFKTYESKKLPGMYFAGEVIDVDAITGGFNFQNAWTGGYIAAQAIANAFK